MEHMGAPLPALLVILTVAYLILGGKVLLAAAKNISKGQVFDENFLMSIATLGAFAIQEYPEAVGVMLFYRMRQYLRPADDPCGKGTGRVHGYPNPGFRGKCGGQQA